LVLELGFALILCVFFSICFSQVVVIFYVRFGFFLLPDWFLPIIGFAMADLLIYTGLLMVICSSFLRSFRISQRKALGYISLNDVSKDGSATHQTGQSQIPPQYNI
jgi:hypothetical protein